MCGAAVAFFVGCSPSLFGFSDTWQLVINTTTTIITFLMVFVIQNTQNRDTASLHIKIDELIRVTQKARTSLDPRSSTTRRLKRCEGTICSQYQARIYRAEGTATRSKARKLSKDD